MAIGRILTSLASVAGVVLGGLWVRHRGVLAVLVTAGVLAVYPDAVGAAHTVLVEPWLVVFTLAGLITVFDRDQVTSRSRRLGLGGVLLGAAGLVEGWAIVPVLVLLGLIAATTGADRWRRAGWVAGGVAAGFIIPVAPFLAASPHGFYRSLITAQIGPRLHPHRVPLSDRLSNMAGLTDIHVHATTASVLAVVLAAAIGLATLVAWRMVRPGPLDLYVPVAGAAVVVMFLWPAQFWYHFSAYLAPFLAAAVALPAATLAARARTATGQPWQVAATGVAAAILAGFTALQTGTEMHFGRRASIAEASAHRIEAIVPPGACVLTDQSAYLLLANRFISSVPGCSQMVDPLGTDLGLSGGLTPATGAGRNPAVAALWRDAIRHAGYVWLTFQARRRVPWTPTLQSYLASNFVPVMKDAQGDILYVRKGLHGS
jgi:hypothetical protein